MIKAGAREGPGEEKNRIRDGGGMLRNRQETQPEMKT